MKNQSAIHFRFKLAFHPSINGNPDMLGGQDMKELSQPNINKPFVVSLKKTDKRPSSQTLEGQTDGSISFDHEINAQQRICAWCNKVMREGTKPGHPWHVPEMP